MTADEWTTNDKVTVAVRFQMVMGRVLQRDLAAVLGISQVSVSNRLNGRADWTLADLDALASYFEVTVGELVEPPTPMPLRGVIPSRRQAVSTRYPLPRHLELVA